MHSNKKSWKAVVFAVIILISALLFFVFQNILIFKYTLLDPGYDIAVLEKTNFYHGTHGFINSEMTNLLDEVGSQPAENFGEYASVMQAIKDTSTSLISQDLITENVNHILSGLIQYIKGQQELLPDILLDFSQPEYKSILDALMSVNTGDNQVNNISTLSYVEKLNLSVLFIVAPETRILSSYLNTAKLVYYVLSHFMEISALALAVLFFVMLLLTKLRKSFKYLIISVLSSSVLILAEGIIGTAFFNSYADTPAFFSSIPYLKQVILPTLCSVGGSISRLFILLGSGLLLVSSLVMSTFKLFGTGGIIKKINRHGLPSSPDEAAGPSSLKIKHTITSIIILLLSITLLKNVYAVQTSLTKGSQANVLANFSNGFKTNTQIVSDENNTVYSCIFKIRDIDSHEPVTGVKIKIYKLLSNDKKVVYDTVITNNDGDARSVLSEGSFQAEFDNDNFPKEYNIPDPVSISLKTSGSSYYTIYLAHGDSAEQAAGEYGNLQVEAYDEYMQPVQGLMFTVKPSSHGLYFPDEYQSVTNSRGMSLFKLKQNNYIIELEKDSVPPGYDTPTEWSVKIERGETMHIVLQLVAKTIESSITQESSP